MDHKPGTEWIISHVPGLEQSNVISRVPKMLRYNFPGLEMVNKWQGLLSGYIKHMVINA